MPRRALQSLSAMYSASLYIFVLYFYYHIILYYSPAPPRLAVLVGDVLGIHPARAGPPHVPQQAVVPDGAPAGP